MDTPNTLNTLLQYILLNILLVIGWIQDKLLIVVEKLQAADEARI